MVITNMLFCSTNNSSSVVWIRKNSINKQENINKQKSNKALLGIIKSQQGKRKYRNVIKYKRKISATT